MRRPAAGRAGHSAERSRPQQAGHAGNILADLFARDGRDKSSLSFVAAR
jgi:hypothetical protein